MDKELIFRKIKKAAVAEKSNLILQLCSGKKVLDVGCVGQDLNYDSPGWLHNRITKVAVLTDGVDIETEGIRKLREKGYSIFTPDELKSTGKAYDIVLMADVIEHVNDPVEFLKFYASFLNEGGKVVITTPNSHGIRNFTSILVRNSYSVNPEHTFWFCPKTMMEVTDRAGLQFADFYWLREYYTAGDVNGLKNKSIYYFNRLFERLRSNFHPNFMFIVSR